MENDYPPFPPKISADLKDFLLCCFHKDPNKRSTSKQLLEHKWIQNNITRTDKAYTKGEYENIFDIIDGYNKPTDINRLNGKVQTFFLFFRFLTIFKCLNRRAY